MLRLLCDFEICCGVEILESLHYAADSVVRSFKLKFLHLLDTNSPQEVRLKCGSFLSTDWSDGDVVFANSTCFEDDLVANLAEQAERLKPSRTKCFRGPSRRGGPANYEQLSDFGVVVPERNLRNFMLGE